MTQNNNNNNENNENEKDTIPDWVHRRADKVVKGLFAKDDKLRKKD